MGVVGGEKVVDNPKTGCPIGERKHETTCGPLTHTHILVLELVGLFGLLIQPFARGFSCPAFVSFRKIKRWAEPVSVLHSFYRREETT